MNVDEVRVDSVLVMSHLDRGRQSGRDKSTWCRRWGWDISDESPASGNISDCLPLLVGGGRWWRSLYGCLVTEINDSSHALSSSRSCLSSPFPELSIITVGLYFTFLIIILLCRRYPEYQEEAQDLSTQNNVIQICEKSGFKVCKICKVLISF